MIHQLKLNFHASNQTWKLFASLAFSSPGLKQVAIGGRKWRRKKKILLVEFGFSVKNTLLTVELPRGEAWLQGGGAVLKVETKTTYSRHRISQRKMMEFSFFICFMSHMRASKKGAYIHRPNSPLLSISICLVGRELLM